MKLCKGKSRAVITVSLVCIGVLLSCTRRERILDFELVGVVKTGEESFLCSKYANIISDSSAVSFWEDEMGFKFPQLDFRDNSYYIANGRLKRIAYQIENAKNVSGDKCYLGYFLFEEGPNDTVFIYQTSKIWVDARPEVDWAPNPERRTSKDRHEISADEWKEVVREMHRNCNDTLFGEFITNK